MPTLLPAEAQVRGNPGKAVVDGTRVRGADIVVSNGTERDSLDQDIRKEGMWVRTADDGKTWQLGSNLSTWTEVSFGGVSNDIIFDPANPTSGNSYQTIQEAFQFANDSAGLTRILMKDSATVSTGFYNLSKTSLHTGNTVPYAVTLTIDGDAQIFPPRLIESIYIVCANMTSSSLSGNTGFLRMTGSSGLVNVDGAAPINIGGEYNVGLGFAIVAQDYSYIRNNSTTTPMFTNGRLTLYVTSLFSDMFNNGNELTDASVVVSIVQGGIADFERMFVTALDNNQLEWQRPTSIQIRPDEITTDIEVLDPPGFGPASTVLLSSSQAVNIDSIIWANNVTQVGAQGTWERTKTIINTGGFNITFKHQAGTPIGQVISPTGNDYTLESGAAMVLVNDWYATSNVSNRWRIYPIGNVSAGGSLGDSTIDVTQSTVGSTTLVHNFTDTSGEQRSTIIYDMTVSCIAYQGRHASFKVFATFTRDGSTYTERDVMIISQTRSDETFRFFFDTPNPYISLFVECGWDSKWRIVGTITVVSDTYGEA